MSDVCPRSTDDSSKWKCFYAFGAKTDCAAFPFPLNLSSYVALKVN